VKCKIDFVLCKELASCGLSENSDQRFGFEMTMSICNRETPSALNEALKRAFLPILN